MELAEPKEFHTQDSKLSAKTGFIEPGILATFVLGNADEYSSAQYAGYVAHLFETEGLKGMIVDGAEAGEISTEAIGILGRSDALKFIRRIGVYNAHNPIFRTALEGIIRVAGRDNIKIFQTMEEALAYVEGGAESDTSPT
jgi:hypothetical protein